MALDGGTRVPYCTGDSSMDDQEGAVTVERAGRGLPGIPRGGRRQPARTERFLEATVVYRDGRVAVEHTERNDAAGRKEMDRWGSTKLLEPEVDYIAVDLTERRAQEGGSYR